MNQSTKIKAHWSFWLISILMLVWNVMGSINFVVQMNPEMLENYMATEQALVAGRPLWATVAFAIAVFGGALGCLLLLFRKQVAVYVLLASLVGVVVTGIHTFISGINFGVGELVGMVAMPLAVAIFLVWYAIYARKKGWLAT